MIQPLNVAQQEDTCATCLHYKPNGSTGAGWCTANPPHAQMIMQRNAVGQDIMAPVSFFPLLGEGERCGQHKKRERYDA